MKEETIEAGTELELIDKAELKLALTTLFANFSVESMFTDSLRIAVQAGNVEGCIKMVKEQYLSNPELMKQILAVELLTIITKL